MNKVICLIAFSITAAVFYWMGYGILLDILHLVAMLLKVTAFLVMFLTIYEGFKRAWIWLW